LFVLTVVVFEVVTGAGTSRVVVVVVCDACGVESGTQIAHPAAPRLPAKQVKAIYIAVVFIFFFIPLV